MAAPAAPAVRAALSQLPRARATAAAAAAGEPKAAPPPSLSSAAAAAATLPRRALRACGGRGCMEAGVADAVAEVGLPGGEMVKCARPL
eukprot:1090821-Pelagomonas_calceolata.AAC.1